MMKILTNLPSRKPNASPSDKTPSNSDLTSKITHSLYDTSNSTAKTSNTSSYAFYTTPVTPRYPFRYITKSTSKTINNLIKRIKIRQRKKILEDDINRPSDFTLTSSSTGYFSNSSNNDSLEDELLNSESEISNTTINNNKILNPINMDLEYRLNSMNLTNHSLEQISTKTIKSNSTLNSEKAKTDVPEQKPFKLVDLLKPTTKTISYGEDQTTNDIEFSTFVKPGIIKSDHLDQRILEVPSSTKDIKLDQDRVIIWDELKDCIQPFGPSHDQPLNEDIHSINPTSRNKFDQWESKEFNKRVLSSPSFNVGTVTVRAEEIGLVLVILLLWAGAISLFINRWGKLRMLEPYQPQYTAPDPTPPPRTTAQAPFININIQSTSSLSLNDNFRHSSPVGAAGIFHEWGSPYENHDHLSPRKSIAGMQSISIGGERCPSSLMMTPLSSQRRVRSAVDLVSLVMQEKIHTGSQFAATNV